MCLVPVRVSNTHSCSLNVVQVSSVEVVQAYIDRIQEVNPLLNAMIKDRQDKRICPLHLSHNVDPFNSEKMTNTAE